MARIIVKRHTRNNSLTLAICDDDLIGKTFEDEHMHLKLSESFYKGKEEDEETISNLLHHAISVTVVGKTSTDLVKKTQPDLLIKKVQDVPFANIFKI